jgi:outer membrane protein TolC
MRGFFKAGCRFSGCGWLLTAFLLLGAARGWAESPLATTGHNREVTVHTNPPPWAAGQSLTLEPALRRALACDSRIASLKAAAEVARQERRAATDLKDPSVAGASRSLSRNDDISSEDLDNESKLSAEFYVPNPWLMIPRVDARTADYEAAKANLEAGIWLVRCQVIQLFAQLDYLTNELAYNADQVRFSGEVLNAMQARLKQGAVTASELMTPSRQFLQFQNELDRTSHNYQLARRQLAALLDIAPDSFELATNALPQPPPEPGLSFQEAETLADRSRYDLAALRWGAQAAQSSYHEVRNEAVPWIKDVQAGVLGRSETYWVGLSVNVPIFTWTKNHAADAARAKATLASVEETNCVTLIRQELHDAIDEVDETRRQEARNELNVKPMIETMQQALASLKASSNVMPEQVAAAELQLIETLRFDLDTRWQYELALFELERTLGAPLSQSHPIAPPR